MQLTSDSASVTFSKPNTCFSSIVSGPSSSSSRSASEASSQKHLQCTHDVIQSRHLIGRPMRNSPLAIFSLHLRQPARPLGATSTRKRNVRSPGPLCCHVPSESIVNCGIATAAWCPTNGTRRGNQAIVGVPHTHLLPKGAAASQVASSGWVLSEGVAWVLGGQAGVWFVGLGAGGRGCRLAGLCLVGWVFVGWVAGVTIVAVYCTGSPRYGEQCFCSFLFLLCSLFLSNF
jgi:hypothetical protein